MNERVADVQNTEDTLTVQLMGRRIISVPLGWHTRQAYASAKVRALGKLQEVAIASIGRRLMRT